MITQRIELIDEYTRNDTDDDYHYNDNHGRLIRCRECRNYNPETFNGVPNGYGWCELDGADHRNDWYCGSAKLKEVDDK